jgi:hypothetical protein
MGDAPERPISFAADIRPLFRPLDIDHMAWFCDLASHEDVRKHAQDILDRLQPQGPDVMPPPDRGGPWNLGQIRLFEAWIDGGCAP